jgi:hypothetical protein
MGEKNNNNTVETTKLVYSFTILQAGKVACSITDDVTGIFHWHNPSGRTMALGFTLPQQK